MKIAVVLLLASLIFSTNDNFIFKNTIKSSLTSSTVWQLPNINGAGCSLPTASYSGKIESDTSSLLSSLTGFTSYDIVVYGPSQSTGIIIATSNKFTYGQYAGFEIKLNCSLGAAIQIRVEIIDTSLGIISLFTVTLTAEGQLH